MNGNDNNLNLLYEAFEQLRAQNTQIVRHAEEVIQEYMHQPQCIYYFFSIIMNCEVPVYRQMAALFMRKVIVLFWNEIDQQNQNDFKRMILDKMQSEPEELVRRAICGVVSVLAAHLLKLGQWPEILERMNTLISSESPKDREMGQLLVFALHQNILKYVSITEICNVLACGLNDNDKSVRIMAVKASCDVIIGQTKDIDYSPFSSLLSLILNLIPDFVQNQDYEVLLCILNMFDDLNTIDDPFYEPFIPSILQICCTLLQDNSLMYSARCLAGNAIASFMQNFSSFLTSNNLVEPVISVVLAVLPEGILEDGSQDTTVPGSVCDSIINIFALHFKTSMVYQAIMAYAIPRASSQQWEDRYVAATCIFLIIEGCKKFIRRDLEQLCQLIRPLLHDSVPVVCKKASYFFTEVSEYLGSALTDVAPWLIQDIGQMIISQNAISIENGLVMLETIGIGYGRSHQDEMMNICPTLLSLIQQPGCPTDICVLAMSCVTVVVMTCKSLFEPLVPSTLSLAYSILVTRDEEHSLLRRRALEFIGKIILHCGYSFVVNDIETILTEVDKLMNCSDSSFAITAYNFFEVLACICKPSRPEYKCVLTAFATYLPEMIDLIWGDHDVCVSHRHTAADEFGKISSTDTTATPSKEFIVANTVEIKKKAAAIDAMMAIVTNVQDLMDAYYQDVVNCLLISTAHIHDTIRNKAYDCLESMLTEIYYYEDEVEWDNGEYDYNYSPTVTSLIENYLNVIYESIIDEEDSSVYLAILSLLDKMVNTLGPRFLLTETDKLFSILQTCIQDKTVAEENYREENDYIEGVEEANSHPLPTAAMDVVSSIVTVLGANESYLSYYTQLWNDCAVYLSRWNSGEDLVSCISFASTLLEVYGEQSIFVVNSILDILPISSKYDYEYCRANSYYIISRLITTFPLQCEAYLQQFTQILQEGLQLMNGDSGRAEDNAICALIHVDLAYPGRFTEIIANLAIQHLPLKIDTYEEQLCIKYLQNLLANQPAFYLSNLPTILSILCEEYEEYDNEREPSEISQLVIQQIHQLQQQYPNDFNNSLQHLQEREICVIMSLLNQ